MVPGYLVASSFPLLDTVADIAIRSPSYTSPNPNCDEKRYIAAMVSALEAQGWSNTHYIVDQGRSGKQPTGQLQQGDWCNA
jgi:cellulose 1,4-beta-cellobiosidase